MVKRFKSKGYNQCSHSFKIITKSRFIFIEAFAQYFNNHLIQFYSIHINSHRKAIYFEEKGEEPEGEYQLRTRSIVPQSRIQTCYGPVDVLTGFKFDFGHEIKSLR